MNVELYLYSLDYTPHYGVPHASFHVGMKGCFGQSSTLLCDV